MASSSVNLYWNGSTPDSAMIAGIGLVLNAPVADLMPWLYGAFRPLMTEAELTPTTRQPLKSRESTMADFAASSVFLAAPVVLPLSSLITRFLLPMVERM